MRPRIISLFFAVLILVFISSCSLPSKTTTTTAKCLEINSQIEQIPTVVELSVDSMLVKIDSCWTDSLLHQTFSVQKKIDNLIGRALEQYDGDVFVLPNSVWERQGIGFLKTEHYLSVTGYIGRYKKFRTATLEDIKTINEYKYGPQGQQPDAPLTAIYLGRNDLYGGYGAIGDPGETPVKKVTKKVEKKPFKRKKGFAWGFDYNVGYGYDAWSFLNIEVSFGTHINENIFLGGGAGLKDCRLKKTIRSPIGSPIDLIYQDNHGASIYGEFKWFMTKTLCAPVFDMKVGLHAAKYSSVYLQGNIGLAIGWFYIGANVNFIGPNSRWEPGKILYVELGPMIAFHF